MNRKKYPGDVKKQAFVDMFNMSEPERFIYIASTIMGLPRNTILPVIVDEGPGYEGKADRYVAGIRKINSRIYEVERTDGPVPNTVYIVFGRHDD